MTVDRRTNPLIGANGAPLGGAVYRACAPCVVEPLLKWQRASGPNLPVYIVTQSDPKIVKEFRKQFKITLPLLFENTRRARRHGRTQSGVPEHTSSMVRAAWYTPRRRGK